MDTNGKINKVQIYICIHNIYILCIGPFKYVKGKKLTKVSAATIKNNNNNKNKKTYPISNLYSNKTDYEF